MQQRATIAGTTVAIHFHMKKTPTHTEGTMCFFLLLGFLLPFSARASDATGGMNDTRHAAPPQGTEPSTEASEDRRAAGTSADRHQTEVQGTEGAQVETEHGAIALHGWAEGGVQAHGSPDAPEAIRYGATLNLARLAARYSSPKGFAALIQADAAGEHVRLLDAVARVGQRDRPSLQAGRFRVPLSAEVLVPAPQLVLPTRMLLANMSPSRAVGVVGTVPWHPVAPAAGEHGPVDGALSLGAFDPVGDGPHAGVGSTLVASLDQGLAQVGDLHVATHVAASAWLHPEDVVERLADDTPPRDRWGDVAVAAEGAGWTVSVEGLASRRRLDEQASAIGSLEAWDVGLGALVAKRVPLHRGDRDGIALEPALGWDDLREEGRAIRCGTAAMNLHHDGWHLVESIAYQLEHTEGEQPVHMAYATLQVGF